MEIEQSLDVCAEAQNSVVLAPALVKPMGSNLQYVAVRLAAHARACTITL